MCFDGLKSRWLTKKVILQHNVGDNKLYKPEVAKWYSSAGKSLAPGASPQLEAYATENVYLHRKKLAKCFMPPLQHRVLRYDPAEKPEIPFKLTDN